MKLYAYSRKLLTFVEARWIKPKFAVLGILMGIIIPFSILRLNQSVGFVPESRSASTLAADNNYLRQQVSSRTYRVNKIELEVKQLNERDNNLLLLLQNDKIMRDTVSRFTITAKEFKHDILILAGKSLPNDFNRGLKASNSTFLLKTIR